MEVFTQRNFVADFIRLNLNYIHENDEFAFRATLWGVKGNIRTLSIAHWKARGWPRSRSWPSFTYPVGMEGWVSLGNRNGEWTVGPELLHNVYRAANRSKTFAEQTSVMVCPEPLQDNRNQMGGNSQPLSCKSDALPIELPHYLAWWHNYNHWHGTNRLVICLAWGWGIM